MRARIIRTGFVFLFFCIVLTTLAQQAPGKIGIGLYSSGIKLVGGKIDASVIDYASGISMKYSFSQSITGEVAAGIGWVRPRDSSSYFKISNAPYRTYIYPWNINIRYNLKSTKRLNPYLGIGAGLIHWDLRNVSKEDKWFPIPASGTSITGSQLNSTIIGAGGVEYFISENLGIDLGFRYSHMLDQTIDNIGVGDINTGLFEVRLSMGLFFGGFIDTDNDGIEDKLDADPYHAEDFDSFQDEDGGPDYDNDNDGIPDSLDKAPDLAEDIDGFQDEDGIPDYDNDNDGIPDSLDKAPNLAEDIDGFQDEDGIPDYDNDNDGIPDSSDACPNEPETFNGYKDDDGCPDEKPKPALIFEPGGKVIFPEITFASAKTDLNEAAKNVLNQVVETLRQNPNIHLEIRGFTDSIGKASSNLRLSQKRAESVKDYLVKNGAALNQLRAVGYGEANPITANNTAEGRSKNRRIEFYRLE